MISTYIRLSYRSLLRKKLNTIISVIGLAIGFATALLVGAYIFNEHSFDKFHKNYNRIYRLVNKSGNTAKLNKDYSISLVNSLPGIKKVCRLNMFHAMLGNEATPVNTDRLVISDSTFFQVFTFPLISGSRAEVLKGPNKIVLASALAAKLFPKTSAVGKLVRVNMLEYCTVTGIMEDSPENSSIQPEAVVSLYTKDLPWTGGDYWTNNGQFHVELYQYFILTGNEKDTVQTRRYIQDTYSEKWTDVKPNIALQRFAEMYSTTGIDETSKFLHTNKKLLFLLISIGVIVLLLGIINTFNILLSESFEESRRACMLKSNGASKRNIILQELCTISITLLMALIMSFFIIVAVLPWFSTEVERMISIRTFLTLPYILFVIGTYLLLTISIGIYPSLYFANSNPIDLFRKSGYKNFSFSFISRTTLVFQFVAAIALMIAVITIIKQTKYIKSHELGYKPDYLIFIPVHYTFASKTLVLKQELLKNPSILQATASFGAPGNVYLYSDSKVQEKQLRYWEINADEDFFSTLNIKLKEGRFFLPGEKGRALIVNEKFYKEAEFRDLATATCNSIPIVGVVENFNTESLHNEIKPGAILFSDDNLTCLSLRISSVNIPKTLDYISKVWKNNCPDITLNYTFYDEMIEQQYLQEKRLASTIGASSGIAIFISFLGLFSMILFVIKRRTKEISIRKINGAKVSELVIMLIIDYVRWVLLAFVIASPVAYYSMHKWQINFAYKTELSWWIFVTAGLLALFIAVLTVSIKSWRAAIRNPVETLRYD